MRFSVNKLLKLQIRGKLAIAFAGLSILPVLVVGYLGISANVQSLRQIAVENLSHDLSAIKERTSAFFQGLEDNVHFLAASSSFHRFVKAANESEGRTVALAQAELLPELIAFAQRKNIFHQINFISRAGDEILGVARRQGRYEALPDTALNRAGTYFYIYLAHKIPPNQATFIPVELRGDDEHSLFPAISCIYPIYEPEFSSVLILHIDAPSFFEIVEQQTPHSPAGTVMLANAEGYYLYHSEKKKDWNRLLASKETQNLRSDYGERTAQRLLSYDASPIHEANGELIAHAPIFGGQSGFDSEYTILKSVPEAKIFAPVNAFKKIFFGVTGFFLFVSLFLAYLATRQFTEPIQKLRREAEVIANGDYHSRVDVHTYDEIEALAYQFNIMAESLEKRDVELAKHREQLEQMVQARTKELQDEKSKLQVILDNVPSGFILLDKNYTVLSASAALQSITGKPVEAFLGRSCHEVIGNGHLCVGCPTEKVFRTGQMDIQLHRWTDAEDDERYVEHLSVPLKKDGQVEAALEILTDVTERKRLQDQLIRSEKLATTGEIAAVIAHEMRNSLTSVRMILQLLSEAGGLSPSHRESLNVAMDSVGRMERVVSDLLQLTRPTPLNKKPENLNAILQDSIEFVKPQLAQKEIQLHVELFSRLPEAPLDRDHAKEAVVNLLLNASQAIDGRGDIRLRSGVTKLKRELRDLGEVGISRSNQVFLGVKEVVLKKGTPVLFAEIKDTGCGMAPDQIKRIFDPFFTTKINGTGLGLSFVKRVVNEHGGLVTVESEEGKGSKFCIFIPV